MAQEQFMSKSERNGRHTAYLTFLVSESFSSKYISRIKISDV